MTWLVLVTLVGMVFFCGSGGMSTSDNVTQKQTQESASAGRIALKIKPTFFSDNEFYRA